VAGAAGDILVPHAGQKGEPSAMDDPQLEQNILFILQVAAVV